LEDTENRALPTVGTLRKIGRAFDVGLQVRFEPWSAEVAYMRSVLDGTRPFTVLPFDEDMKQEDKDGVP
jgi:hypothetical protein